MYPNGYFKNPIKFETALLNYDNKKEFSGYVNLVKKKGQKDKIKLEEIFIDNNKEQIFSCLVEMIYQVRCLLFHGELEPTRENYEVIKSSFFILEALIV